MSMPLFPTSFSSGANSQVTMEPVSEQVPLTSQELNPLVRLFVQPETGSPTCESKFQPNLERLSGSVALTSH